MKSYDLYGFTSDNLDKLAESLGRTLGVTFSLHESSYRGGDYYRSGTPGQEEFVLQSNYDQIEDEIAEPEFPKYSTLLYVGPTDHSEEIKDRIEMEMKSAAVLLRHRVL
jgi:hypothetical protein